MLRNHAQSLHISLIAATSVFPTEIAIQSTLDACCSLLKTGALHDVYRLMNATVSYGDHLSRQQ